MFLLIIVLSVRLRFIASDYPFDIFILFSIMLKRFSLPMTRKIRNKVHPYIWTICPNNLDNSIVKYSNATKCPDFWFQIRNTKFIYLSKLKCKYTCIMTGKWVVIYMCFGVSSFSLFLRFYHYIFELFAWCGMLLFFILFNNWRKKVNVVRFLNNVTSIYEW